MLVLIFYLFYLNRNMYDMNYDYTQQYISSINDFDRQDQSSLSIDIKESKFRPFILFQNNPLDTNIDVDSNMLG